MNGIIAGVGYNAFTAEKADLQYSNKGATMANWHPSKKLAALYKGYQGARPDKAKYIFIGSDANFSADIEKNPVLFKRVKEYLINGVKFWRKHGVHHPFVLPEYQYTDKTGWWYHYRFQKIGFNKSHATKVSFLELFHRPTKDSKNLSRKDLNEAHLKYLYRIITFNRKKCVFITEKFIRLLENRQGFDKLLEKKSKHEEVVLLYKDKITGTEIYKIYHFSGQLSHNGMEEIRRIVDRMK